MSTSSHIELLSEFENEFPFLAEIFTLVVKNEIEYLKGNGNRGDRVKDEDEYPEFFIAVRELVRNEKTGAILNNSCSLNEEYPEIYELTIRYIREEINSAFNNSNSSSGSITAGQMKAGANVIRTALHNNPFCILGVTTRDDRRRIVELAEEKSLTLDGDVCTKAKSDLITRNRLAVEMAWLPGLSPNSARVLVDNLHSHIDLVKKATTAPALAKANLLAAAIELLDPEMDVDQWCDWIVEFAYTVDMIEPEDVLREINEDRSVSGFHEVKGIEQIEVELRERQRYYTDTIKTALNRFSPDKLVDVVTRVVETTTDTGEEHGASLVHDLVERYEADANRDYLQPEAENIKKLAEAIRQAAHKGESSVKPLVDKLIQVVNRWDSVAQPIQLSVKARGLDHDLSYEVAHAIRNLGLDLFNKHDMLDTVNRLTKTLQELFAELPEMLEKLDQDAETLDEIHGNRKEAQKRSNEWAKEIFYQAEIGLVFKDTLRISTKGVEWKDKCFPLDSITWVKWGAVSRSVNGVPTGTDYTIAVGDNRSSAVIETRKNEIYSTFTDKLWRAVCVRLLTENLESLKSGKSITIGGAVIDDNGVQLTKHKFFGNETEYRDWGKVTYVSSGGSLFITAQDDKKVYVSLPYLSTPNAHILEAMIRLSFKKWTGRLSGLLND